MKEEAGSLNVLKEQADQYCKTNLELFKLRAIGKSADLASSFILIVLIVVITGTALLLAGIGLALWIGKMSGDSSLGFFVVAGFVFLIAMLIFLFRFRWVKLPLNNSMIRKML